MSGTLSNPEQVNKWFDQKVAKRAARAQRKALNAAVKQIGIIAKGNEANARKAARAERLKKAGIKEAAQVHAREMALDFTRAVGKLTNWQRNQWARKGYPGLIGTEAGKVTDFVTLTKPTTHRERVLI